jgi:hypothetical protein
LIFPYFPLLQTYILGKFKFYYPALSVGKPSHLLHCSPQYRPISFSFISISCDSMKEMVLKKLSCNIFHIFRALDYNDNDNNNNNYSKGIIFCLRCGPTLATTSLYLSFFLDHTQRPITVGRNPLDE